MKLPSPFQLTAVLLCICGLAIYDLASDGSANQADAPAVSRLEASRPADSFQPTPERPAETPTPSAGGTEDTGVVDGADKDEPLDGESRFPIGPAVGAADPEVGQAARDVRAIICAFAWPCEEALRVVYGPAQGCPNGESAGREDAQGAAGEAGLFQIGRRWHEARFLARGWTWADAYQAERNAAIAFEIWTESGWSQWSCRP